MRVLHVVEGLAPLSGGIGHAAAHLSQALKKRGIEGAIITTTLTNDGEAFQPEGVVVQAFPRKILRGWSYAPRLSEAIEAAILRTDLIHLHGLWGYPQYRTSRMAWDIGKPYLVCPHGMLDRWALNQSSFKKRIYGSLVGWRTLRRAAVIHALGDSEAADIKRLGITTRVVTIPNGIHEAEFERIPSRQKFIDKPPTLADKIVFRLLG